MQQNSNYITLMNVVQSYMNERNEKALTRIEKYLNIVIEGYSQINLFELNTIKTVRLELDVNTMTARLPADFITMTKIGLYIRGNLWTLTVNNDLVTPIPNTICGEQITPNANLDNVNIDGGFYFSPYWYGGVYYNTPYGRGGGINTAYYKIDINSNTIIFQGFVGDYPIILEYKGSGAEAGTFIPRQALPALKAYLDWANKRHDLRYSEGQIRAAEERYNIELYSLSRLELSFNYDELVDTLYATYRQSAKR